MVAQFSESRTTVQIKNLDLGAPLSGNLSDDRTPNLNLMLVCPWCQESIRYSFRNSLKLALRRSAFGTDGIENEKDQKSKIFILQLVAKVFDGQPP